MFKFCKKQQLSKTSPGTQPGEVERLQSHSQIFRNLNFFRQNCTLF